MRAKASIQTVPLDNTAWWNAHVRYSKFRRQGIDIICASAEHHTSHPRAKIVFLTGLAETFIKYSELIQFFYEKGFNVYTYDHQSQGLSGRCTISLRKTAVRSQRAHFSLAAFLTLFLGLEC